MSNVFLRSTSFKNLSLRGFLEHQMLLTNGNYLSKLTIVNLSNLLYKLKKAQLFIF